MNNYKPNDVLKDAVLSKNISAIKTCLINIIKFDPTFKTNNFEEALQYVNKNNIDINVSYKKQDDEYIINDKVKWNREYFYFLTEWFRRNFAVNDRLPYIREVGERVFGEDIINDDLNKRKEWEGSGIEKKREKIKEKQQEIIKKNINKFGNYLMIILAIVIIISIINIVIKMF